MAICKIYYGENKTELPKDHEKTVLALHQVIEQDLKDSQIVNYKDKIISSEIHNFDTYAAEINNKFNGTFLIREGNKAVLDVTKIAYDSYAGLKLKLASEGISEAILKQGSRASYAADTKKKIKKSSDLVRSINQRVTNGIAKIKNSTEINEKKLKLSLEEFLRSVDNDLEVMTKENNINVINQYLDYAYKTLENIMPRFEAYRTLIDQGKDIHVPKELSIEADHFEAIFSLLDDIQATLSDYEFTKEFENSSFTSEDLYNFKQAAININAEREKFKKLRIEVGKHHIASTLAPYSNRARIDKISELTDKYKNLYPIRPKESFKVYNDRIQELVMKDIANMQQELKILEKQLILNKLNSSPFDVDGFSMWVSSEKDLNSTVIQLASKLLDEADLIRDANMLDFKLKAATVFAEFDAVTKGVSAKEKYKDLYELGSNGQLYLTGEYSVNFLIEYRKAGAKYFELLNNNEPEEAPEVVKAKKEFNEWKKNNIINKSNGYSVPVDKWKNPNFEKLKKEGGARYKMLDFLRESTKRNNKLLHNNLSLISRVDIVNYDFMALPSVGKNTFEKVTDGNIQKSIANSFRDIYKARADETQYGQLAEDDIEKRTLKVLTDIDGDVISGVPIHFRRKIDESDVSYDLLSSIALDTYMAENYNAKTGLQVELELLKDVVEQKQFDKTIGSSKITLLSALDKNKNQKVKPTLGVDSNEYKVLKSIIDNRLYGKKSIYNEYAEIVNAMSKWTASSMLMFNWASGSVNAIQGQLYNFIEANSSQFFDINNYKKGQQMYWRDFNNNLKDVGQSVMLSKTNQLIDLFNLQGSMKAFSNKFIENTRAKALMSTNTAYALSHMGEHYMHGTLMYAILDKIKVLDKDGDFIDVKGNKTTEKKAASLGDAFILKDKKLTLIPNVHSTTYGIQKVSLSNLKDDKALLEVKQLIGKIAHDLHGNYNPEIKSAAERIVILQPIFMLRKWLAPGFNRRWRGTVFTNKNIFKKEKDYLNTREESQRFYSEDLQSYQEGYYATTIRFLANVVKEKLYGLDKISKLIIRDEYSKLSPMEQQNIKRFVGDFALIIISYMIANLLYGLAEGLPEDDIARQNLVGLAYVSRRLYSETATYMNVQEAWRIANNPAASLSYIRKLSMFGDQLISDGLSLMTGGEAEKYERTYRKGQYKIWKRFKDITPLLSQTSTSVEEKYNWLIGVGN